MKKLAVICLKSSYLKQLSEVLPRYLPREWSVNGFDSADAFFRASESAQVILAQVAEADREAFSSRVRGEIRAILWLTETEAGRAGEVFMYRSASEIAEKVLMVYGGPEQPGSPPDDGGFQVIGYIGAEGGSGCTTEAYRKAVMLSAEGRTAFVCLDNTPGLKELSDTEGGISELIYLLREYGETWTEHIDRCVKQVGSMSVFAGVERIGDAVGLKEEESEQLLTGLRTHSLRNVVIDFGDNASESLLSRCDTVYVLGANETKRKELERQAQNGGYRERLRTLTKEKNGTGMRL